MEYCNCCYYFFQVAALNKIGKGAYSPEVTENLQHHKPYPSLYIVREDSLYILDADLQQEVDVLGKKSRVQWVAPLLKNSSVVWMDLNSDIYMTYLKENSTDRVCMKI